GVGDFVGAHGTPTKMTDAEVNQMLHQEEEKTTAEPPKVRINVERGDRVKIKDGPFENFEGDVEEVIEGRGLVKVMLTIFNRPTPVDLEYWQVEKIGPRPWLPGSLVVEWERRAGAARQRLT